MLEQQQLTSSSTAKHSTAQHSTAQHSTAQHSTAQHSTALHSSIRTVWPQSSHSVSSCTAAQGTCCSNSGREECRGRPGEPSQCGQLCKLPQWCFPTCGGWIESGLASPACRAAAADIACTTSHIASAPLTLQSNTTWSDTYSDRLLWKDKTCPTRT